MSTTAESGRSPVTLPRSSLRSRMPTVALIATRVGSNDRRKRLELLGSCDGARSAGSGTEQSAKREQFTRLIARGVSNAEACRIVGINRRTGKRWRHGRTITSSNGRRLHYAPALAWCSTTSPMTADGRFCGPVLIPLESGSNRAGGAFRQAGAGRQTESRRRWAVRLRVLAPCSRRWQRLCTRPGRTPTWPTGSGPWRAWAENAHGFVFTCPRNW
jgi:hypothetical protein